MTACNGCSINYTGSNAQHCLGCHATFGSTEAGDRHRVGEHGVTHGPDRRRCLIGAELLEVGLEINDRGHWVRAREPGTATVERMPQVRTDTATPRRPRGRRGGAAARKRRAA